MKKYCISLFLLLVVSAPATANFEKGVAAYAKNNIPLAFKEFTSAAKQGDSDAQFNLALMHEQGLGTVKNEKAALAWYKKAGEAGNMFAQYNVAVFYENGRGTKVDFTKANLWYRKAVAQKDALAMGNLGMLYIRADGVAENKTAGLALLILSATLDRSPENIAKQNIASTRGLNADIVQAAQSLSTKMGKAHNSLVVFDKYLQENQ